MLILAELKSWGETVQKTEEKCLSSVCAYYRPVTGYAWTACDCQKGTQSTVRIILRNCTHLLITASVDQQC